MKKNYPIACLLMLSLCLFSCRQEAEYAIRKVALTYQINTISSGLLEVTVQSSKEAYFITGVIEQKNFTSPVTYPQQFMQLMVDSAYRDYVDWRYDLLRKGEPFIADFQSHSLSYTSDRRFFTMLAPSTDYWFYTFVVDPNTKKPCGDLVCEAFTTTAEPTVKCTFDYRIDGDYEYVYPRDENGHIFSSYPYSWLRVDSLALVESGLTPAEYARVKYEEFVVKGTNEDQLSYGVAMYINHTPEKHLQDGHTYYTMIAPIDGGFRKERGVGYKFRWDASQPRLEFHDPADKLTTPW